MLSVSSRIKLGRYRLLGELGQGGTATVSLAVASGPAGFNKLVVLKTMKHQFLTEPGFSEMFMTEARVAARLNHPNIVQTNEVFEQGPLPVIVMEYLEGKSLADIHAARQADSAFGVPHQLAAISEALSGLHYSHELTDYEGLPLELVHRDVTPHNVFVTYEGQVKILDFGIAKLRTSTVETETGVVKGKLRYIPPEQIVGEPVDRRADIYSVGVMLWEVAVGEKMWRGLGDAEVMNRVINERIPPPSEKHPSVDPRLERLIMRALSPDPAHRHQTALELQQDLDTVRRELPEHASVRDLGPALSEMFSAERRETQQLIEQRLADTAEDSTASGMTNSGNSIRGYSSKATVEGAARYWLLLPSAALLFGAVLWLRGSAANPTRGDSPSETAPNAARQPESNAERTHRVRITAYPKEARIFIDGQEAASNPLLTRMLQDDKPHRLRVLAPGFEEYEGTFDLHDDTDSVIRLSRLPLAPSAAPAVTLPKVRRAPRSAASNGESNACDPPYVVDERGIKRFKPECVE